MAELSMYLPTFAADMTRRRRRLDSRTAILHSVADSQREVVAACCGRSYRAGIAPGMTLSHARALLPAGAVHVEPHDPPRDARALLRLAEWALRLVPIVAPDEPDGLRLDASGCERLYRGVEPLLGLLHDGTARLGFACRIAAAPSFGAAWGLARLGECDVSLTSEAELRDALCPLPVEALRVEQQVAESLRQVGIARIGDLFRLPRSSLPARYGDSLLRRLDQALGVASEPIQPVRSCEPIAFERVFDGPTDRLEAILAATRELVEQVAARLRTCQSGCRRLTVRLDRSDLPPEMLTLRTARSTHDARHLWSLLRPMVEGANMGFGVEGIAAEAGSVARLRYEQASAWTGRESDSGSQAETARLVDTMVSRLGPRGVLRYQPLASHLHERSFRALPVEDLEHTDHRVPELADADRPTLLYTRPLSVGVVLLRPEGPIASVLVNGQSVRVRTSQGPERIAEEWWRGQSELRDYYRVHTDDGRWLWLFRVWPTGRWFIHGEWA